MITKKLFVEVIESMRVQYIQDVINKDLLIDLEQKEAYFIYDNAILYNQIINLLSLWFDRNDLTHFCFVCDFGKLDDTSIEDFYEQLNKKL
jgi:hypothetical protein